MTVKLYAPSSYWLFDKEILKELVNGCGPGGWKVDPVPDTVYGLPIEKACNIHDFMYFYGETEEDRDRADRVLKNNINRIIDAAYDSSKIPVYRDIMRTLRRRRAKKYYFFVHNFGGPHFWVDKNQNSEFKTVPLS